MNEGRHISICAPARLHMGFMDMHGGLGRNFGSLGLAIAEVATRLTVTRSAHAHAEGPAAEKALRYAQAILGRFRLTGSVAIHVHEAIPEHVGLGSGTQLALAVSAALNRLYDLKVDVARLAAMTERGMRSGIGIGAFTQGGFLVDGGRGAGTVVPPVVSRVAFPESWRVVLIFDHGRQGLHGQLEREAFERLPPMSREIAGELCRCVLMQLLPAVAEEDFERFSDAVTAIQNTVGDQFAAFQGGRYTSTRVAAVLEWLAQRGVRGLGQSSWGPTGFALFETEEAAHRSVSAARRRWQAEPGLAFMVTRALNSGAVVQESSLRRPDAAPRAISEVNLRAL